MNQANRAIARALLLNHDCEDVVAIMSRNLSGEPISLASVQSVRRHMVRQGKLDPMPKYQPKPKPDAPAPISREQMGCDRLHDATIALYERTANRRKCSVEAARLFLTRSPEQLVRMAMA